MEQPIINIAKCCGTCKFYSGSTTVPTSVCFKYYNYTGPIIIHRFEEPCNNCQ